MKSGVYRGRLYQNRRGLVMNLVFMLLLVVSYALSGLSCLFLILLGGWIMFLTLDFLSYADRRRSGILLEEEKERVLSHSSEIVLIHLQSHKFPLKMNVDVSLSDYLDNHPDPVTLEEYERFISDAWGRYSSLYDENRNYEVVLERYHSFINALCRMKGELSSLHSLLILVSPKDEDRIKALKAFLEELDKLERYDLIGGAFDSYYIFDVYRRFILKVLDLLHFFK